MVFFQLIPQVPERFCAKTILPVLLPSPSAFTLFLCMFSVLCGICYARSLSAGFRALPTWLIWGKDGYFCTKTVFIFNYSKQTVWACCMRTPCWTRFRLIAPKLRLFDLRFGVMDPSCAMHGSRLCKRIRYDRKSPFCIINQRKTTAV